MTKVEFANVERVSNDKMQMTKRDATSTGTSSQPFPSTFVVGFLSTFDFRHYICHSPRSVPPCLPGAIAFRLFTRGRTGRRSPPRYFSPAASITTRSKPSTRPWPPAGRHPSPPDQPAFLGRRLFAIGRAGHVISVISRSQHGWVEQLVIAVGQLDAAHVQLETLGHRRRTQRQYSPAPLATADKSCKTTGVSLSQPWLDDRNQQQIEPRVPIGGRHAVRRKILWRARPRKLVIRGIVRIEADERLERRLISQQRGRAVPSSSWQSSERNCIPAQHIIATAIPFDDRELGIMPLALLVLAKGAASPGKSPRRRPPAGHPWRTRRGCSQSCRSASRPALGIATANGSRCRSTTVSAESSGV